MVERDALSTPGAGAMSRDEYCCQMSRLSPDVDAMRAYALRVWMAQSPVHASMVSADAGEAATQSQHICSATGLVPNPETPTGPFFERVPRRRVQGI